TNGGAFLAELEARERERTGIANLRVAYNSVHGYYIEVSNAQVAKVPTDYRRRQTLKNAERYITPELKAFEDKALSARDRAHALAAPHHRAEHGRQVDLHAPGRAHRADGAHRRVRTGARRAPRPDRPGLHAHRRRRRPRRRALHLHGGDDRKRSYSPQRDRQE